MKEKGVSFMNKRAAGTAKEQKAAEYLESRGFKVRERNYRSRQGERDIIGCHEGYLVFVEVKYRSSTGSGYAAEAVSPLKQRRICRVADFYRYTHGLGEDTAVRYDVVAIQGGNIEWLQNAFPHVFAVNH